MKTNRRVLATGYPFGSRFVWRRNIVAHNTHNQHLFAVGNSGVGKSMLLHKLLSQDINLSLSDPGSLAILFIDPHGTGYEGALNEIASYTGKYQIEDRVVLIEPCNTSRGHVGLNVIESPRCKGILPYEIVSEVIASFKAAWKDAWGARMEDLLRFSCIPLQESEMTICQISRFLTDENFRNAIVNNCSNPDARMFWKHFSSFKKSERVYFVESCKNKISQLTTNPYLKMTLCQKNSTIDFFKLFNEGKIILANFSMTHLKAEDRKLLGHLLLGKVHTAIMARDEIPSNERKTPVVLYIDEAHEVYNRNFVLPIFTGGRKFSCSLNIFDQSLSQYEPEDANIIVGNSATLIAFALSRRDAELMAKNIFNYTGEYTKYSDDSLFAMKKSRTLFYSVQEEFEHSVSEITRQGVGQCFILLKGQCKEPYIANTYKIQYPEKDIGKVEKLRELSAKYYNKNAETIHRETEEMEAPFLTADDEEDEEPTSYRG